MSAYPQAKFLKSAQRPGDFPAETGVEVAIAGRSNSGKSSAINALTQRKALARTSKTPGATRLINFFELAPGQRLVDLPGYGFAAVARDVQRKWRALLEAYFGSRRVLAGAIVVMDVRHPLTDHDGQMLELARSRGLPVHVLLTKADKLSRGAGQAALAAVRRELSGSATVQLFSAVTGEGAAEARAALVRLLEAKETPAGPAEPAGECEPGVGG